MQAVTLATALLGAVLGILNWWRNFNADRVRLRIGVGRALVSNDRTHYVSVTLVNVSNFAVTITAVGFDLRGTDQHIPLPGHWVIDGGTLPKRLESRAAITALAPIGALQRGGNRVAVAYAETACGHRVTGGRKALRNL